MTTCGIVLTGTDPNGGKTCALRCITAEVFGECAAADGSGVGKCVPPKACTQPVFNPNDPNRCDDAQPFSVLQDAANNPEESCT